MTFDLAQRVVAEGLGSAMLVATVVGSGIMAERLSKDVGVQLLGNTLPTGAMLVCLITIFGPVSGAHFNPAVSLIFANTGALEMSALAPYVVAQIAGGILGTWTAHAMFQESILQVSQKQRSGPSQWFAEAVAIAGLIGVIFGGLKFKPDAVPWLVGLYITAAYWFTASTSFANPAVTIARCLTNTFSGIRPRDVPGFIIAQLIGVVAGEGLFSWLFSSAN